MALTEVSSLDASTRSMMALNESVISNMTYPGSDIRAMNTTPVVSAMGENNSTATPTPTDLPTARTDYAPTGGPPSDWKPPANGKLPDGWKPPDGAPQGSPPTGSTSVATPTPMPSMPASPIGQMPTTSMGGIGQTMGQGIQTGTPSSSSQSMTGLGNSLYDYVGSMRPTIPSLFKS